MKSHSGMRFYFKENGKLCHPENNVPFYCFTFCLFFQYFELMISLQRSSRLYIFSKKSLPQNVAFLVQSLFYGLFDRPRSDRNY